MATLIISGQVESNELRYTEEQTPVCALRVRFEQFNGKGRESTHSVIRVTAWQELAKRAAQQFAPGSYVVVQGKPSIEEIEHPEQPKRRVLNLMATQIQPGLEHLHINQVSLSGRVGQDPEMLCFESGSVVSHLSLAVRRSKQQTDWFNLEGWGKTAELLGDYVHKGDPLGIEGYFKIDTWQQNGIQRSKPVIGIQSLQLLGAAPKSSQGAVSPQHDVIPF
jgi:single-strand DNA-binding protein